MQILIQVLTSHRKSLRDIIVNDKKLDDFRLKVSVQRKPGRAHGWAKLHSNLNGVHGALNIEWEPSLRMLTCRFITKGDGKPDFIIADFIEYLLTRHRKKIESISILPR